MQNDILFKKFISRISINDAGGLACYWGRRNVIVPMLLQKMGVNKEVNVPLFFGSRMNVITGEVVSTNIIGFGYSEVALTALMLKVVTKGQNIVDIGTHFGYEALLASVLVGETGSVNSFEPNPHTFAIASKNLNKPNIKLHNKAVGDHNGSVKMQDKPVTESAFNYVSHDNSEDNLIEVDLVTLDSALAGRKAPVDFMKCDVEGFEMQVLKGAADIITKDKPLMVLEADMPSESDQRANEISTFLSEFGYKGYSFDLKDDKLVIADLHSFAVSHANILFVHQSKQAVISGLL